MIETLEIYKDNQWHELDLLKPSGITIKFESPIIKGFDALTSDKSYSFTLPLTSKNALALGLSSDIRIEDNFSAKYECSYKVNGVSTKGKSYIYLTGVDGELSANIVLNVFDELVAMKDDEKNINELDVKKDDEDEYTILELTGIPHVLGQIVGQIDFEEASEDNNGDYDTDFEPGDMADAPDVDIPDYDAPDYDY